jgi:hypothetical protein
MVQRLIMTGLLFAAPALAAAQENPAKMVEVDPIRCWWRTSSAAVRMGETFTVGLTCAVLEADGVQVIPDESQLTDSAIQLNPFEVIGGSHPPDLRSGQRRFFQYEYIARVINPDVVGQDVPLPNLVVHYRVNSRLPGNAAMQGRDLSYLLPPQTIRVLSLVPSDATDIRDTSGASFARVEALGARAGVFEIAAVTFVALGSLMTIVSLFTLARGARRRKTAGERMLPPWRVAHTADRELAAVARESQAQGWNDELVDRALSAMRVTAASLVGGTVSQSKAAANGNDSGGRIVSAGPGLLDPIIPGRQRGLALSSAITAHDLRQELARLPETASPARRRQLETLADALGTFTAAQYGSSRQRDGSGLDEALSAAAGVSRRLRTERLWSRPPARRTAASMTAERQA